MPKLAQGEWAKWVHRPYQNRQVAHRRPCGIPQQQEAEKMVMAQTWEPASRAKAAEVEAEPGNPVKVTAVEAET